MKAARFDSHRFFTDATDKQVGVLPDLKAQRRLREAMEELADIRAYDAARPKVMAKVAAGDFVTLDQFVAQRRRQ